MPFSCTSLPAMPLCLSSNCVLAYSQLLPQPFSKKTTKHCFQTLFLNQ